ncbi:MAG TPA: adenylate/guanylate cyclase domain-containing protein [Planctomycetota bacterium]|nr:adenylate/guanylate cyclase domain-containing protein [Planctomycetota bacterium]
MQSESGDRVPATGGRAGSDTELTIPGFPGLDASKLTLTEIIQLQNGLSRILKQRFERERALAFTDVVGSTAYFQRFGDEVGRRLIQRHNDLVAAAVAIGGGRVVDTAGDGAFTCFPGIEEAAKALIELQKRNARENQAHPREHRLSVRAGLHWGSVLADETFVTGDSVNYCARVASAAQAGEIRLSGAAFLALPARTRVRCRALPPAVYKGIPGEHEQWLLAWREDGGTPRRIRISELKQEQPLPDLDTIRFGRLAEIDGKPANDVILELPDPALTQKISRWHFTLERMEDGRLLLRQGSGQLTEVDGVPVPKGASAPIGAGSVVRIGGVMTITFLSDDPPGTGSVGSAPTQDTLI